MSKNRIIYNQQSVFASSNISSGYNFLTSDGSLVNSDVTALHNLIFPISRVQSASYSFSHGRTDIKSLGQYSNIMRPIYNIPDINLSMSYYPFGILNEKRLGLTVNYPRSGVTTQPPYYNGFVSPISGMVDRNYERTNQQSINWPLSTTEPRNIYVACRRDNSDFNNSNTSINYSDSRNIDCMAFGDCFLTSYKSSASVGSFPICSVDFICNNVIYYSGGSGLNIPSLNSKDATIRTGIIFNLPSTYEGSGQTTVILPKDITLNISTPTSTSSTSENKQSVTLSTNERRFHSFIYAKGLLFGVTLFSPTKLIRFNNLEDLSDYSVLTFPVDDAHTTGKDCIYVSSKDRIYIIFNNAGGTFITEVNPDTLAYSDVYASVSDTGGGGGIVSDGTHLYVTIASSPSKLFKISLTDFSLTSSTTLTGLDGGFCLQFDGTSIYAAGAASPGWIAKITPSDLSYTSLIFDAGDNQPADDMAIYGDYIFVGLETSNGKILRINKSDLLYTTIYAGTGSSCYGTFLIGSDIWAVYANSPGKLVKINPNTLNTDIYTFESGENQANELATDGTRLFITFWLPNPAKVVRINIPFTLSLNDYNLPNDLNDIKIQGYDIDLQINREPMYNMGYKLPLDRRIVPPTFCNLNINYIPGDNATGAWYNNILNDKEYNITIRLKYQPRQFNGIIGVQYDFIKAKFNGINESLSIGSNKSSSLSFTSELYPNDSSKGFFISGQMGIQTGNLSNSAEYLLLEDGSYLLLEDGSKIIISQANTPKLLF